MKNADLFRRENEYADFDAEGAVPPAMLTPLGSATGSLTHYTISCVRPIPM